jgi:predicted nucleic acid-binding protein
MPRPTAIYDACVLYPAPLRDLLLQLACEGLFHARWTDAIHEEWIRNLLKARPDLKAKALDRTRRLMDQAVPDALIKRSESLVQGLDLPDPDDRHVLAAAIHGGAQVIVTFNLKDFPPTKLKRHGVKAMHPDKFIADWIKRAPEAVCLAAKVCRQRLKNPPMTIDDYVSCLAHQGLDTTAAFFAANAAVL